MKKRLACFISNERRMSICEFGYGYMGAEQFNYYLLNSNSHVCLIILVHSPFFFFKLFRAIIAVFYFSSTLSC